MAFRKRNRTSRRIRLLFRVLVFLPTLLLVTPLWGAEPGADPRLSPPDGLAVWLDASRLASSDAASPETSSSEKSDDRPALVDGDVVTLWPDSSGHHRDFRHAKTDDAPKFVAVEDGFVVRFDGKTDHLRFLGPPTELTAATLFVVAAPRENLGDYAGLFASNAATKKDYESGLNLDLGPDPTAHFETVNAEGCGFGGMRDLLTSSSPMGTLHTIELRIDPAAKQVRLAVDGVAEGTRPFDPKPLAFEHLTIGARAPDAGDADKQVRCFLSGDIAEVLVFDRVLTEEETTRVRTYLTEKYAHLTSYYAQHATDANPGVPLVKTEHPPAVQMLMPGFEVRELPLELRNINNVRYRDDGRLVTLGYNGDIHLLSDTDGDGLEDHADLFWKNDGTLRGPIGMLLTPPGYAKGRGVFVPSKGRVSLIVDTDGDDRADKVIEVASGWSEIFTAVDALGITMDKAGNLYFGLGVANFADAYQIDKEGVSQYKLHGENGTIQKVSPDFQHRETVCTGIRFPVALAFNEHGDLFCSEQEGATWLPNGNPFDELLHIQTDRHYGFPPRHPRHNPDVIDEPSTYDFGPQHQSTCGMVFNQSVNGGPLFGPPSWANDALIVGESRGKLWHTQLVKTEAGYVASTQLYACLQMLTIDNCVAPNGDLVVACHSGPPDWGTGPTGIGKLFRITMTKPETPRPVATWAENPREIRIAFDRPLDPQALKNMTDQIQIEYGVYVRAGDRYDHLVPPYAAVQRQLLAPRFHLDVTGTSVTNDLRTLIIGTAPMERAATYAITLPMFDGNDGPGQSSQIASDPSVIAEGESIDPSPGLPLVNRPQIDVDFALTGVKASWLPAKDTAPSPETEPWSGWLPHLDLSVSQALTEGSAEQSKLWSRLKIPGSVSLGTQLDLHHILRPKIQPGETIDYQWPPEMVTVTLRGALPFGAIVTVQEHGKTNEKTLTSIKATDGQQEITWDTSGDADALVGLTVTMKTDREIDPVLTVTVHTNEDARARPLPLRRFVLPWVLPESDRVVTPAQLLKIAELEGGDWGRGRRVFLSEAASCFQCHSVGGDGARIGPDLSNLIHRDYASVLRDVINPSYAINPDYLGYLVSLKNGRVLTGVPQTENGELRLGDEKGTVTRIRPDEIEEMKPATISIMPTGLLKKLSNDERRDLMTYLLTPPPSMPLDSPLTAPPVRTRAELAAVLAGAPDPPEPTRALNLVLVAGPKDHGPGEHDYPAWQTAWAPLLTAVPGMTISTAWEFPSDEQLEHADGIVFFQKGVWNDERAQKTDAFLAKGGGLTYLHWALNGDDRKADFARRIGLASGAGKVAYRHGSLTLDMRRTDHVILRNLDALKLYDESYWLLTGDPSDVTVLATSTEDDAPRPQIWVKQQGAGRVFVCIPGHYNWTFDDPLFRVLLLRGIAWTMREPVDRFNGIVPLGARMAR